ncbi:hypothetical protein ppKF707_1692 [Metapseudomonas furukawaii]|uniref:Uncharacterized protein n=1 Tax=Metapseudomonas furukawaii TaxID=1149133 RepID=A0AAD1FG52_METFU|nr:hypothetical protein ppKF707_1692 [Pseudomonas furukawaii]BAU75191.1 hypothetical protein KF707C_35030 [Pseudomonas furukawaii]
MAGVPTAVREIATLCRKPAATEPVGRSFRLPVQPRRARERASCAGSC